jgi:hypothetical protein
VTVDLSEFNNKDFEYGIIKDKVADYYDRLDIDPDLIEVAHRDADVYNVTVTYTDRRLGIIKARYTAKLIDGYRVYFGDAP